MNDLEKRTGVFLPPWEKENQSAWGSCMKDLTDFGFVLGMNFFPIFDFSLCFYASYILSSPEATFFCLIVVVFLPVPTLTQWEWLILCAKMWQYSSRGSFVKVISASNLLSWMTANFQEVCQSSTFTWCVLHVLVCHHNMFFQNSWCTQMSDWEVVMLNHYFRSLSICLKCELLLLWCHTLSLFLNGGLIFIIFHPKLFCCHILKPITFVLSEFC